MSTLRRRLQHWLDASIGNRFSAVLLTLTLGFMLIAGIANFAYLFQMTYQTASKALDEDARDAANELSRTLNAIVDDNRLLAANPTVVSAVLDARGQETYLNPLLSRFRPLGRTPDSLCVTDYSGRPLGCSSPTLPVAQDSGWLKQVIAGNSPRVTIKRRSARQVALYFVLPVTYEGTGSAEGAVVARYDLAGLLATAVGSDDRYAHVHLGGADGELYVAGHTDGVIHAGYDLALSGVLAPLKLHLSLGVPKHRFHAPLFQLMVVYGLIVLLLAGLAFLTAWHAVPPLIARLSAITRQANRVAAGETPDFSTLSAGRDEISQLATSFATMTRRLQETNQSLESQVEARTAALHRQENLLQSIMDAVPGVIFQFRQRPDGSFHTPFVSHALREVFGIEPEEIHHNAAPLFARVHPDDLFAFMTSIVDSAAALAHWEEDFRIVRTDGTVAWLHGNAMPRREDDGAVIWHGIVADITEHKQAALALAESESYTKALFNHSYIPLVIMDPQSGVFIDCNDAAVAIYRLVSREQVLGKTLPEVSAPTQYDGSPSALAARSRIVATLTDGLHVFEWRHQRPGGEAWDAEVRLMRFRHRGQELMQFSLRDITEQKRGEAVIWRRANFDPLTGLANRSLCEDRLDRAMAQARRNGHKVGVLFVDLDGFKGINDSLGHAVGDEVLVEAAQRLASCVREQDTAARFGGDEFVLVVQDLVDGDDLRRVGEAAVAQLHRPFTLSGGERRISGSIGIAIFPDHADSLDALLQAADLALYQAKRAGKNRYGFHGDAGAGEASESSN